MISTEAIIKLTHNRLKDADALFSKQRFDAAYYMCGYAIELSLKLKICKIFNFDLGFPESQEDIKKYLEIHKSDIQLCNTIPEIRQIKNHDLNKLLSFSGVEYLVKKNFLYEWETIIDWSHQIRYLNRNLEREVVTQKLEAIKILTKNIL